MFVIWSLKFPFTLIKDSNLKWDGTVWWIKHSIWRNNQVMGWIMFDFPVVTSISKVIPLIQVTPSFWRQKIGAQMCDLFFKLWNTPHSFKVPNLWSFMFAKSFYSQNHQQQCSLNLLLVQMSMTEGQFEVFCQFLVLKSACRRESEHCTALFVFADSHKNCIIPASWISCERTNVLSTWWTMAAIDMFLGHICTSDSHPHLVELCWITLSTKPCVSPKSVCDWLLSVYPLVEDTWWTFQWATPLLCLQCLPAYFEGKKICENERNRNFPACHAEIEVICWQNSECSSFEKNSLHSWLNYVVKQPNIIQDIPTPPVHSLGPLVHKLHFAWGSYFLPFLFKPSLVKFYVQVCYSNWELVRCVYKWQSVFPQSDWHFGTQVWKDPAGRGSCHLRVMHNIKETTQNRIVHCFQRALYFHFQSYQSKFYNRHQVQPLSNPNQLSLVWQSFHIRVKAFYPRYRCKSRYRVQLETSLTTNTPSRTPHLQHWGPAEWWCLCTDQPGTGHSGSVHCSHTGWTRCRQYPWGAHWTGKSRQQRRCKPLQWISPKFSSSRMEFSWEIVFPAIIWFYFVPVRGS